MNKTVALILKIAIPTVIGIGIMFAVFFWKSLNSEENKVADIVNKGNAYTDAGLYYEAIGCYEQALSYEPDSSELKEALVKSYMSYAQVLGDTQEAIEAYKRAADYGHDNKAPFWAIADIYERQQDEDAMLSILREGYELTGDEDMNNTVANIEAERERIRIEEEERLAEEARLLEIQSQRESLLQPLLSLFANKDYDAIKDMVRTDEYISMSDEVIGDVSFYCGETDEAGNRNGVGLALYENGYYYYGDFSQNLREGNGIYFRAVYTESSAIGSYIFEGTFKEDKPNGEGSATSNFYKDRIQSEGMVKQVIKGNYSSGLEDGSMSLSGTTKAGKAVNYTYKCKAGIAEKVSNDDSGIKGQYIIAKSKDGSSNLTSDGSLRGVEGFVE